RLASRLRPRHRRRLPGAARARVRRRRRGPAPSRDLQHHAQRRASIARPRPRRRRAHAPNARAGSLRRRLPRRRGGAPRHRRRPRHPRIDQGPRVRSILHDQTRRHRPRPADRAPRDRSPSRMRAARHGQTRHALHRAAPASAPAVKPSVLVVDDETGILETLRILLKNEGFTPHVALGGKQGLDQIAALAPDIVITDVRMPSVTGLEILSAARAKDPDLPVILMTAQADLRSAIQAVNEGAYYYIQKPFVNGDIVAILRRAAEHRQLRVENRSLRQEISRRDRNGANQPVGRSKAWLSVLRLAETVAPTESTVLIQGESGTGKEVVARYIHQLSARASGAFLSINCGALPESLLESELFGHVKGSFTGAVKDKSGLFTAAGGGTFFLDEIGETTPSTQVKLLRVLQ